MVERTFTKFSNLFLTVSTFLSASCWVGWLVYWCRPDLISELFLELIWVSCYSSYRYRSGLAVLLDSFESWFHQRFPSTLLKVCCVMKLLFVVTVFAGGVMVILNGMLSPRPLFYFIRILFRIEDFLLISGYCMRSSSDAFLLLKSLMPENHFCSPNVSDNAAIYPEFHVFRVI